jgi:hypothetical protein
VRVEVPGRLPAGAAVAAEVEGDHAPAGQPLGQPPVAEAVGADPVQADDRRAGRVAELVGVEDQPSGSSPLPDGR